MRPVWVSSKRRFREYLRAHRERDKLANTGAAKGAPPGAALLSDEEQKERRKRTRSFWALVREFWGLLRGERLSILLALSTLTVAVGAGLMAPLATKVAIDYIITDHPGPAGIPAWIPVAGLDRLSMLYALGGGLLCVTFLGAGVSLIGRWKMTQLTKRLQANVRRRVFMHAVRLPLHRVYRIKSGGVASILREDAGGAGEMVFTLIYNPWRAVVQLVGTLGALALTDWRLLMGAILLIPAVWISHRTWIARIRPVYRDIRANRTAIDAHATEAFGGMRVVRGFGRQRGESLRFSGGGHLMARQEVFVWWWSRIVEIVWTLSIPTASVAVLVYGGRAVVRGELTIGDLMMFSAYMFMLLSPLEVLVSTATTIQNNLAGLDRILDLLQEPTELDRASDHASSLQQVEPARVRGRVTFSGVSFAYPGHGERVLHGITLDVAPGKTVALVGPSGSGKTTLCNLVARFYDPTEGVITLDGADLRRLDVESYRRLLGIVEQDVFLFDGTIAQNIGYARRSASESQIRESARAANADGFIERLESGYQTLIGERGVRLSGGQKQRIAIARAVLADPRILILDEATSNLDSESETLIQQSLKGLMRGRTCFVIAHRLSTIRHADQIVVLEHGRIIETGTHDELSAREGRYWEMLQLQLSGPSVVAGEKERRLGDAAPVGG
ncbi:MAG: ABC transporter ATP-binding protein [Phycisphaeraceae bacterium]|nr:ABC transporter ATP-binding protein [Phycisphaeraceae bacterium]